MLHDMTERVLGVLAKEAPGQPFDESKHPRQGGRFAPKGSAGSSTSNSDSGWGTVKRIAGMAAIGAAGYYGARYLAAHPEVRREIGDRVSRAYSALTGQQSFSNRIYGRVADAASAVSTAAARLPRQAVAELEAVGHGVQAAGAATGRFIRGPLSRTWDSATRTGFQAYRLPHAPNW